MTYHDARCSMKDHHNAYCDCKTLAMIDAPKLSKLLFTARESLDMWADVVERRTGNHDFATRAIIQEIDEYRASRGWSPNGFGGEV